MINKRRKFELEIYQNQQYFFSKKTKLNLTKFQPFWRLLDTNKQRYKAFINNKKRYNIIFYHTSNKLENCMFVRKDK